MSKLSQVLDSRNFFVTLISLLLLAMGANSIDTGYTADGIFDLFKDATVSQILVLVIINFLNPLIKLVNKVVNKEWSWEFIKSQNFQTQLLSILTILLSFIFDEVTTGIVTTIVLNLWNLVSHLIQKNAANKQRLPTNSDN